MVDKRFALIIAVAVLVGVLLLLPVSQRLGLEENAEESHFSVVNHFSSFNRTFIIQNGSSGELFALASETEFPSSITLISGTGIGTSSSGLLVDAFEKVSSSGIPVKVVYFPDKDETSDFYVVALGAMPKYILNRLKDNNSTRVVYIGRTNYLADLDIRKEDWYSALSDAQKSRILVINSTLDDLSASGFNDVILSSLFFSLPENLSVLEGGKGYSILNTSGKNYVRLYYPKAFKVVDLELNHLGKDLGFRKIFSWEKSSLEFSFENVKGTVSMATYKDGILIGSEKISDYPDQQVFRKDLSFSSPGFYVLVFSDYNTTLGVAAFDVRDLSINFVKNEGPFYYFEVNVGGKPLKTAIAYAWISDPKNKQKVPIYDGVLKVKAKAEGKTDFKFEIFGRTFTVEVLAKSEDPLDVYVKYGPIAALLILSTFLGVRLLKRETYTVILPDREIEASKVFKIGKKELYKAFKECVGKFGIFGVVSSDEFSSFLSDKLGGAYELSDWSVQKALEELEKNGKISSYDHYHSLHKDVRERSILRRIKEALIEFGKNHKKIRGGFSFDDVLVVLPRYFSPSLSSSGKRIMVVFEDSSEMDSFLDSMNGKAKAKAELLMLNSRLVLCPLGQLRSFLY